MKVVLLKKVKNLGEIGDVLEVAEGYARNFLLPKKLAEIATPRALARAEIKKTEKTKRADVELKEVQDLGHELDGREIEIFANAGEGGKLYGAITSQKIAEVLQEKGFKVDKNQIIINQPVKEVGEHDLVVRLGHGLEVRVKIIIRSEEV